MKQLVFVLMFVFLAAAVSAYTTDHVVIPKELTKEPKYVIHWMPKPFDGTLETCKFGIRVKNKVTREWELPKNSRGQPVCTRQRGRAIIVKKPLPVINVTNTTNVSVII